MADPEYEPAFIEIDLRDVTKNVKLDQVRIHKKMHRQLEEATVTSSRILFYHKGDTLVYNASEFVLAEGSMIDALIKQLPGVTLKDNGEITVNGRKVDDLLLNGKDLFNGNRQLMLENIGAYTVKDIAVYEKNTARNEILGREMDKKRFSMDVRLKRQYSTGWNINAEAGYGTQDRYLGKLFAVLFSDNVYFNLRAGMNNLSSPFNTEEWTPDMIQPGLRSTKLGGITYMADGQANKWHISGNTDVKHTDDDIRKTTTTENFLPGGNNYLYSFNNSHAKKLELTTNHHLRLGFNKKGFITVAPRLTYQKNKSEGSDVSALFRDEVQNVTEGLLDNIYRGYTGLADTLIYRNISKSVLNGHLTSLMVPVETSVNAGHGVLNFNFYGSYDEKKDNVAQLYIVNHSTNLIPTTQDFQQRDLAPDNTRKLKGETSYYWDLDWQRSRVIFSYTFENTRTTNRSNVSSAADWDLSGDTEAITIADVQALPGFAPVFSPDLSYNSKLLNNTHGVSASFSHVTPIKISEKYAINIHAEPLDLKFSNRNYRYIGAEIPTKLKRSSVLPGANGGIQLMGQDGTFGYIGYGLESKDAPMQSMVTLPQIDPMNMYIGNPDLKHSLTQMVMFSLSKPLKGQKYHNVSLNARFMQSAITQGYVFNTVTGVRYYHPFNVDGNWESNAQYEFFTPFGNGGKFDFKTTTTGSYINSVDLIGTSAVTDNVTFDADDQKRRYVKDLAFEEKLNIGYKFGENRISALGEVRLNDYRSKDSGFSNFTSLTARYGASGVFVLPAGFGISTDLNVYTRRGFTDSRLNTSDVVWNARLTKSVMKGSMILAVDAYDMLRQLSNITYTVNAQARTEVVTNVVPAYVLFHVQYRFNRQPKR
ncbi:MAG: outer membrane beta-barrel family protein [Muribaculaceae bacterium]|nr:outer membrane beta-barrel family protein [Muribaculaceae bacterium]